MAEKKVLVNLRPLLHCLFIFFPPHCLFKDLFSLCKFDFFAISSLAVPRQLLFPLLMSREMLAVSVWLPPKVWIHVQARFYCCLRLMAGKRASNTLFVTWAKLHKQLSPVQLPPAYRKEKNIGWGKYTNINLARAPADRSERTTNSSPLK